MLSDDVRYSSGGGKIAHTYSNRFSFAPLRGAMGPFGAHVEKKKQHGASLTNGASLIGGASVTDGAGLTDP